MRYVLLNITVLTFCLFCYRQYRFAHSTHRSALYATAIVTILTAIFDPLIIAAGIVAYNWDVTLQMQWFGAPIEDLAYTLAAGLLIPILWRVYDKRN